MSTNEIITAIIQIKQIAENALENGDKLECEGGPWCQGCWKDEMRKILAELQQAQPPPSLSVEQVMEEVVDWLAEEQITFTDNAPALSDLRSRLSAEAGEGGWIKCEDRLPEELETVWGINRERKIALLCCVVWFTGDDGEQHWCWARATGDTYLEDGRIVAECEADDLDITEWQPLPTALPPPPVDQQQA